MLKDIPQLKVEDLAIAILPPENGELDDLWDVFVLNFHNDSILSVLVTAQGYGELEGEKRKTSTFRYFIEEIGAQQEYKLEPIQPAVFELTNEYWVSFSLGQHMLDKKYVFVRGSITPDNFTNIPFINRRGVMIR